MPPKRFNDPAERLREMAASDRGPEQDSEWMTLMLQRHWPGNYTVVYNRKNQRWEFAFDDPLEQTMFWLKYKSPTYDKS